MDALLHRERFRPAEASWACACKGIARADAIARASNALDRNLVPWQSIDVLPDNCVVVVNAMVLVIGDSAWVEAVEDVEIVQTGVGDEPALAHAWSERG
jgi:hypothetical protein